MTVLSGGRLLVLGAAGEVGEGLVRQALLHGAHVLAVSRSGDRLANLVVALQEHGGLTEDWQRRLTPIVASLDDDAGFEELAQTLASSSQRPTAVIASMGGWRQGPIVSDMSMDAWHEAIDQSLTAHVRAGRTLLPLIAKAEGSSYTLVNGGAALRPLPGAGAMCVSAAGQLMLMHVLDAEHRGNPVRINTLLLDTPVLTRSRPSGPPSWITADDAGAAAAYLAAPTTTRRGHVLVLDGPSARAKLGVPFS